jgi:hypothetical protein
MELARFERDAVVACLVMAAVAALVGGPRAGAGVIGGGGLAALSYRGLKAGIFGALRPGRGRAIALVKFFTRYAILAVAAYVMLARFRLPPWAVAAGASSPVVALAVTVVRTFASSRPGNSR